jgi:hypothetical protein
MNPRTLSLIALTFFSISAGAADRMCGKVTRVGRDNARVVYASHLSGNMVVEVTDRFERIAGKALNSSQEYLNGVPISSVGITVDMDDARAHLLAIAAFSSKAQLCVTADVRHVPSWEIEY